MVLVQPIIVRPGTHEDTITAAAVASAVSVLTLPPVDVQDWLASRFTKSVRRTSRQADFDTVAQMAAHTPARVGEAQAVALAPMDEFPPRVRRMQVSGLDCERTGVWPSTGTGPVVVINKNLTMSTGKTAAQVAHGLILCLLTLDEAERADWLAEQPLTIFEAEFDEAEGGVPWLVRVRDAGHTEVAPGTETVRAWVWKKASV